MTGRRGSNRLLTWVALTGIVTAAALVGLLLSARRPSPTPSPSPSPLPSLTVPSPVPLAGCRGIASQAPFVALPTRATAPPRPVSAFGYSVVDDAATHQVVLFGGVGDYDNTWLWNGRRWTLARPRASPPGRFDAAAAYDPVTRRVMVYGGRLGPGQVVCDTWAWTGSTWIELDRGNSQLPPGEGAQMGWDASHEEMILVARGDTGLETWAWRSGWVLQSQGSVAGDWPAGMIVDPASRSLLLVTWSGTPLSSAATWRWDGAAWRPLSGPTMVPLIGSIAVDPVEGHPVLLAGAGASQTEEELWSWDGAGWTPVPGSTLPSVDASEIVTDVGRARLLLFGSVTPSTQQRTEALHTWAWAGSAWQRLD